MVFIDLGMVCVPSGLAAYHLIMYVYMYTYQDQRGHVVNSPTDKLVYIFTCTLNLAGRL